jgi:polyferredoxin
MLTVRDEYLYLLLADGVLALHACVVAFIVGGLAMVLIGNRLHWRWVNGLRFRLLHLGAIVFVVVESWLDLVCPLTSLEMRLRAQAGQASYSDSFIGHWLQQLIYYDAPAWVFVLIYTLFAALVALSWWRFPPTAGARRKPQ